jgi:glycosyltransferase involved in cell wall biosynthesis
VVIAGDGPIRSQIMNLSEKQGLGGIISFPGWISRETLSLYYEAADVFVLTSNYEAGPISLLEAMSYGDAIISSKIQGFPSLMRNGFDGLLFQAGDYHALSYCLKELLDNPMMRLRLSTSARSFAERFDWKCVAEETLSLYATLF